MEKLLEIENLSIQYHSYSEMVNAVNGISLELNKGETLGIVGETGAGKTTTALGIIRLLPKNQSTMAGSIIFDGKPLHGLTDKEMMLVRGKEIAMIFQDPMTSLNPIQTVNRQISEVLELHSDMSKAEIDLQVDALVEKVGLSKERKNEYPHQYSGGMKQRVVIAMALACNPQLLIADEPTSALDVTIQAQILAMINNLKQEFQTSMILISHDLGVVVEMCDKVAIMYAGEIVETGTVEDIYSQPLHPYTQGLFSCIPSINDTRQRLEPISGLMPDPTNLPTGCKFHPRCSRATDKCRTEPPANNRLGSHKVLCWLYEDTQALEG